jgi:GDP-4-dehydro-6-deoxy-D-mannose reductase
MRALVIGADGFAGRWLTKHLAEQGDAVVAGVGPRFTPPLAFAEEAIAVDVRNPDAIDALVQQARPSITFFLAGLGQRGQREALAASAGVTITGSLNVLLSLQQHAPRSRLLFVSSGFVYPSSSEAHAEQSVTAPRDAYGATKLAAEEMLLRLAEVAGVEVVIARAFNHVGPGQRGNYLVPSVAKQLSEVADQRTDQITVGTVTDVRDFSDVRDVVRGYRLIATAGRAGATYNIASGRGLLVNKVIDLMIGIAGVRAEVITQSAPAGQGPDSLIGDASAVRSLGWSPQFTLEETLRDVLAEYMPEGWQSGTAKPTAG